MHSHRGGHSSHDPTCRSLLLFPFLSFLLLNTFTQPDTALSDVLLSPDVIAVLMAAISPDGLQGDVPLPRPAPTPDGLRQRKAAPAPASESEHADASASSVGDSSDGKFKDDVTWGKTPSGVGELATVHGLSRTSHHHYPPPKTKLARAVQARPDR
jgi:hypothetical protein